MVGDSMNKTSKKRKASKHKIRMFAALLIFGVIAISLGYNLFSNVVKIREMKKEKIYNFIQKQIKNKFYKYNWK